ncbi:MAG: flagellar assembly protein H [Syntrophorhabdus sp. PtaB.Bin184]|nr:MAG: flagellar assembly protein H [Syntrophorhabdus sp. PtaB.Bin184]
METFTLHDLGGEMPEERTSDFIRLFDEEEGHTPEETGIPEAAPTVNIEEEARRIFEEAFAQGEKAGHEMGMKRVEPMIKKLGGFMAELSLFKEELVKRAENLSTELALVFAEAIILRECTEHREAILRMVRKALSLCEERSGTTIRLRGEDADLISEAELGQFKIVRDDTMREPGFVIETNFGDIDGRISVQMEELKKEYLNGRFD